MMCSITPFDYIKLHLQHIHLFGQYTLYWKFIKCI